MVFLILALHLLLLVSFRFTAWPEMLSFPYLNLNGFKLYGDMVHPYPPLLTWALDLWYAIFGVSVTNLKIFSWTLILITDIFVYLAAKSILRSKRNAYFVLGFFVTAQTMLDGNMMWFDNALILPLAAAVYFFARKKFYYLGVALFLATLIKQTALIYILVFLAYFLISGRLAYLKKLFLPGAVIWSGFLVYLVATGQLEHYVLWNFWRPLTFWSEVPGYVDFDLSNGEMFSVLVLLLVALVGMLWVHRRKTENLYVLLLGLFLAGLIGTYPRFSFFHLQPAVVFIALLVGINLEAIDKKFVNVYLLGLMLVLMAFARPVIAQDWGGQTRFYGEQEEEISEFLSKEVSVYLLGVHSGNYVLSGTLPPKPWIDNFPWYMEIDGVQEKVIDGLSGAQTGTILVRTPGNGASQDIGVYLPAIVMEYVGQNYFYDGDLTEGIEIWRRN